MTVEELEKEAKQSYFNTTTETQWSEEGAFEYTRGYQDGAEPREKRIEELEIANKNISDECHKLVDSLEKKQNENAELRENLKTAYRKGMRHMAKALKDYDRTDGLYTDYFEHSVDKVLQREQLGFEKYGTLADQLTKAKEIIKNLMKFAEMDDREYEKEYKEAEQFLNEVEK